MEDIKQITMRIPEGFLEEIKIEADQIGSSCNSLMMVLLKLGLKAYNGDISIHQKTEQDRFLSRNH